MISKSYKILSGVVTSVFKDGHGGLCIPSGGTDGRKGCTSVLPINFASYLNYLPSNASSATPLISLHQKQDLHKNA